MNNLFNCLREGDSGAGGEGGGGENGYGGEGGIQLQG